MYVYLLENKIIHISQQFAEDQGNVLTKLYGHLLH